MDGQTHRQNYDSQERTSTAALRGNNNNWDTVFMHFTHAPVLRYTMEANSRYSVYTKNRTITQTQQIKMHILNQVQVNLIYNMNRNLFLLIKILISTTDLYNTTADRCLCHLPNRSKK